MSTFDAALGEWMAEEREDRDVSQETVAQQMQLEQPTVSKIERGQRRVNVKELLVWANVLGIPTTSVCLALDRLRSQFLPDASMWASSGE